ncbi:MAG: sulfatase-like hydrolase/transferase, partial [Spirochaetales bacterium]|nr:sulfatase-like hydrolase/transferase [Spirochaetales bacterium]
QADYATALTGKWHLGYGDEQHPLNRGFDEFYGFLEAFSYFADPRDENIVSHRHDLFWENHIWNKKRKGPSAIQKKGVEIVENRHLTDAITAESIDFIKRQIQGGEDKPFFLLATYNAPHTPFQELREYYDQFPHIQDENRRIYAAMIRHLDDGVGELLSCLDELGIRDNTLILFASDNGGASYTLATENGELAGGKLSQFEGGLEVPFLISWPGRISPGSRFEEPVTLIDMYSTVLQAAEIPLPENRILDSVDLLPYVNKTAQGSPHDVLFWKSGFNLSLRRDGWKLMYNSDKGEFQLYNLMLDRGESTDLSGEYPERARALLQEALELESQCLPPLWPRVMDFEIEVNGKTYLFAT